MKFAAVFLLLTGCAHSVSKAAPSPAQCRETFEKITLEKVTANTADPELVFREEVFELPGTVDDVFPAFVEYAKHLENMLPGTKKFAAVHHNEDLTADGFPAVGSQRVVCLVDGHYAFEEVLGMRNNGFNYVVSNYSLDDAKPILYGLGDFNFEPGSEGHVKVTWRYSFKLRGDVFPGSLGGLGRSLFRSSFLESDYAEFMKSGVVAMQRWGAERATKR